MRPMRAYLTVSDADGLLDFYKRAFDAEVGELHHNDAGEVMHAQVTLFGDAVMLAEEMADYPQTRSPKSLGGTSANLMVMLGKPADVDAQLARGEREGGMIVMPAQDVFWGARFGMLRDPSGHVWAFGAPLGG